MQRNINYSETLGVSVALSSIAISSPFAKTKILHDNELNPFVYAIGYGCDCTSSVIVGGIDEDDQISSYIIIKLAQDISNAYQTGKSIMGIDVAKILSCKGIWFIPNYKACKEESKIQNLMANSIFPTRMLELTSCESGLKYSIGKNPLSNIRLLAFLFSASSGIDVKKSGELPQDSLSNWFLKSITKPVFRMGIGKSDEELTLSDADTLYRNLIELFLLFIIS